MNAFVFPSSLFLPLHQTIIISRNNDIVTYIYLSPSPSHIKRSFKLAILPRPTIDGDLIRNEWEMSGYRMCFVCVCVCMCESLCRLQTQLLFNPMKIMMLHKVRRRIVMKSFSFRKLHSMNRRFYSSHWIMHSVRFM